MFYSLPFPIGMPSCEWFLMAGLPNSPVPLLEYISLSQYKYYLMIILEQHKGQYKTDEDDVLKLFKPEVSRATIHIILIFYDFYNRYEL